MDAFTLALVGAAYGGSLVAGFGWRARRRASAPDGLLAAIVFCSIVAMLTIAAQHREVSEAVLFLQTLEYAAGFAIGPLLLFYVGANANLPMTGRDLVHFLPSAATLGFAPFAADPLLGAPVEWMVAHQIVYTGLSLRRFKGSGLARDHHRIWLPAVLAFMVTIHLAQLARIVWSASSRLENIIPVALAVGTLVLGAAMIWIDPSAARSRKRPSAGCRDDRAELAQRAVSALEREHHYRDPALSLHGFAALLETTPHELSAAINETRGETLNSILRRVRLQDAKRRLDDPAQDHLSIEGVGLMSGFGSRSSFYEAFRVELGTTPAQYRTHRSP